jgi:hypothetical protein
LLQVRRVAAPPATSNVVTKSCQAPKTLNHNNPNEIELAGFLLQLTTIETEASLRLRTQPSWLVNSFRKRILPVTSMGRGF